MDELKQIADRVTVMRDGSYVGTVDAAQTPVSKIISMMVGRELTSEAIVIPDLSDAETVLDIRGLNRGRRDPRRQLFRQERRDPWLCRLDGSRADGSGTGDFRS